VTGLANERVLVAGASGFIGRAICRRAASRGIASLGVLRPGNEHRGAAAVTIDPEDVLALAQTVRAFGPTMVINAAGAASVADSVLDPITDRRGNVQAWLNVLDAIRLSGSPATAVNISSAAVYGEPERLPLAESASCRPISPYGHHKLQSELAGDEYSACFGIPVVSARVFSVLGPAQRRLLAWEIAAQALSDGGDVRLRGSGEETRDFIHVDDLADALLGLGAPTSGHDHRSTRVNVATGVETSVATLAVMILAALDCDKPLRFLGQRSSSDPQRWQADVGRLSTMLPGWQPRGICATVDDCVSVWKRSPRD